jgi:hypothetical protein
LERNHVSRVPRHEPGVPRFLSNVAWILTNLTGNQQPAICFYVARIRCYQPAVFTHFAKLFSNVARVRLSNFAVLLSHIAKLFADVSILLTYLAELQPDLASPPRCYVTSLQPHVASI